MNSNHKTALGITAALGMVAVAGMSLGIVSFATIVFVALLGVTVVLAGIAAKSGKLQGEDPLLAQIRGSENHGTGDEMNSVLDELEVWVRNRGLQIYINWLNTQITAYPIFSLEGEVFWFYSFIVQDKESGQELHICVESQTQRIVKYGQTLSMPKELYWPQDYVPAIDALENAQRRRTSKTIKSTLEQIGVGRLQGNHDFSEIPVDKTAEPDNGIVEARTTT